MRMYMYSYVLSLFHNIWRKCSFILSCLVLKLKLKFSAYVHVHDCTRTVHVHVHVRRIPISNHIVDFFISVRPTVTDSAEGLRRSRRTRVLPLRTHLSERIRYERRRSGLTVAGIKPAILPDDRIRRNVKPRKKVIVKSTGTCIN